ncbi:BrnT family toxin [bacterium]|nr:BrnT family toxin [bacterium]
MKFDWDDTKNRINQKKHGVWFEEAQTVWADEYSVEFFDPEHSEGEDRFIRIGMSSRSNLLIVVFCERDHGDIVRIISARKATDKEKKSYEEGI